MDTFNSRKQNPIIDITNINEKVYDLIKKRIVDLEYPPGSKINIRQLQEELNVSNSPIKDALFRLAGEGMVDIDSRRGTFVKEINEQDIREIEWVRTILEMAAVEYIAPRITTEQLSTLERLYEETLFKQKDFNYKRFMEKDFRFHQEIINLTNNRRMAEIYNRLNSHMQIVRFQSTRKRKAPLPWTNKDHASILKALKDRDPKKAKRLVKEHRAKARDAFLCKTPKKQKTDI